MADDVPKKILIADDEKEVLVYLTNILKRADYEVVTTSKGNEVVALAEENNPDIIILDIVMPDLDGGEVASLLSQNKSTANIPIIYLTALITKEEELIVKKSGKNYVVAKPTNAEELLNMVRKVFSDHLSN